MLQDIAAEGTVAATNASLPNPIWATALVHQQANQLKGKWLYLNGGAGAQQERAIYASTPFSPTSPSLLGRIDVLQSFATTPSTNTTFEVYSRIQPSLYNNAIQRRIRAIATRILDSMADHSVVLGSRLTNGTFQIWTNGTTVAPDGWTFVGTNGSVAQATGLVYPNTLYGCTITNGNAQVATLAQSVADYQHFANQSVRLRAVVDCLTGSRFRIQLTDGVNTWYSDYHNGNGEQTLDTNIQTAAANPSALTATARIETGGVLSATILKMWLDAGEALYQYPLNSRLVWVREIYAEGVNQPGVYSRLVPDTAYYIDTSTTPAKMVFYPSEFQPLSGVVLRVIGQSYPLPPVNETDNLEVDPDYITYRVAQELLGVLPWGEEDRRQWQTKYKAQLREADLMEDRLNPRPYPGSKAAK